MAGKEAIGEVMITREQIEKRAEEIGAQISRDFEGKEIIVVGILKGAVIWMGDILKNIDNINTTIDFMICSSYGAATKTSGVVKIVKDLDVDIDGKHVIIVEDIIDSGITINYLKSYLKARNAESVSICTLLDKPSGRKVDLKADYVGFDVEDKFIIGYGLDFDQKYRQLPYVSYLN